MDYLNFAKEKSNFLEPLVPKTSDGAQDKSIIKPSVGLNYNDDNKLCNPYHPHKGMSSRCIQQVKLNSTSELPLGGNTKSVKRSLEICSDNNSTNNTKSESESESYIPPAKRQKQYHLRQKDNNGYKKLSSVKRSLEVCSANNSENDTKLELDIPPAKRQKQEHLKQKDSDPSQQPQHNVSLSDRSVSKTTAPEISQSINEQMNTSVNDCFGRKQVGGKGFFLHTMQQAGLTVPPFRCVESHISQAIENHHLSSVTINRFFPGANYTCIADIKKSLLTAEPENKSEALARLAQLLESDEFYQQISQTEYAQTIRALYEQISQGKHPVIARSSGVAEDSYGDAQAGKYDSRVKGQEDIVKTCLQVLASGYKSHASSQGSIPDAMPIVLQRCINCSLGGVAMSYTSLDDNTIQINSSVGQPKTAVSGTCGITPDLHSVDRMSSQPQITFTPGKVESTFQLKKNAEGDGFYEEEVSTDDIGITSLSEAQVTKLTEHIKVLEDLLLCPVDVEFGVDKQGELFIVQVRPVTRLPGAMNFGVMPDKPEIMTGTVVSEGVFAGTVYHAHGPSCPLEKGNIVVADHFYDEMLKPEFLDKAGGFIFKKGGLNDHVAISLRQAGKPYFIAGDSFQWPEQKNPPEQYTLACGNFNGEPKAALWEGDHTEILRKNMVSSASDQQPPKPLYYNSPPVPADFTDLGKGFEWLNQQNTRLLKYFMPGGVFNRCLETKSVLSVSMSANRQQLVTALKEETSHFLKDTEALLDGYEKLLAFSDESGKHDATLQQKIAELNAIKTQFRRLSTEMQDTLETITQPFVGNHELPESATDFESWKVACHQLNNFLQQLTQPNSPQDVNSIHDIVFLIHKAFIEALPIVSKNSSMGVTKTIKDEVTLTDFVADDTKGMLSERVITALKKIDCNKTVVVHTKEALIITASLGIHKCVIESLASGDGGKGAMVRLKFSDDMNKTTDGKRQRMLLISLFFEAMGEKHLAKHINPSASELVIENTQMTSEQAQEETLLKMIAVIFSVRDVDTLFNEKKKIYQPLSLTKMTSRIQEGLQQPNNKMMLECYLANQNEVDSTVNIPKDMLVGEYADFYKLGIIRNNKTLCCDWLKQQPEAFQEKALLYLLSGDPARTMGIIRESFSQYYNAGFFKQALSMNTGVLDCIPEDIKNYDECILHALNCGEIDAKYLPPDWAKNPRIVKAMMSQNGMGLENADELFKKDKEIVLAAVKQNGEALKYASESLQKNKEVVLAAVKQNGLALEYADKSLKEDNDIVLVAIKQNGWALRYTSKSHKKNKEIVLAAVKQQGLALQYASESLKKNKVIVLTAIRNSGTALKYADKRFKANKAVVLEALKKNPWVFVYVDKRLKEDKEIFLEGIKIDSFLLVEAGEKMNNDKEVVMTAVRHDAMALKYASEKLKADKEIVMAAIQHSDWALKYASEKLKKDKDIIMAAVQKHGMNIEYADEKLKEDKEVIIAAIKKNNFVLKILDKEFRLNQEIVLEAIKQSDFLLAYTDEQFRSNKDIVLEAVKRNGMALHYASEQLKADQEVVMASINENGMALQYASEQLKADQEVVMAAINQNGLALKYADKQLQSNQEIALMAVRQNPWALKDIINQPELNLNLRMLINE